MINRVVGRFQIINLTMSGTEICQYSYSNTILAVKLNRARLVVCLEESLYIHNIRDMKVLHTIRDTPANPRGLCSLSINSDNCYLAYPGSTTTGEVQLFDAFNLQVDTPFLAATAALEVQMSVCLCVCVSVCLSHLLQLH